MSKKKETLVRRGNLMTAPSGGWLHDEEALCRGAGVFFTFPVKYLGSIQVLQSLGPLDMGDKTSVCREGISRTAEAAKARKPTKRKTPKICKQYLADAPYVKPMELKINLSADGFATSDLTTNQIISHDPINKISYAAGGEGPDYFFLTYVAKDKRDNRYCHVFDCGKLADDVLATFGQIFNIITTKKGTINKRHTAGRELPKIPPNQQPVGGGDNPMYWQGAAAPQTGADGEVTYDNPDAAKQIPEDVYGDDYDQMLDGAEYVEKLRQVKPSNIGLYGDEEDDDTAIYGDGQAGWEYLKMEPEAVYGDLAEFATSNYN